MKLPKMKTLDPLATYRAPSGRLCRCVRISDSNKGHKLENPVAFLAYHTLDGRPAVSTMADGFTLAQGNWPHLRQVPA